MTYTYSGPQDKDELVQHMKQCNPKGPLVIHICKLFPKADTSAFDAYGRILSGTVKPGDRVRVLGEAYTPEDEEDSSLSKITNVWVYQAFYRIPVTKAAAGEQSQAEREESVACLTKDYISFNWKSCGFLEVTMCDSCAIGNAVNSRHCNVAIMS